MEPHLNENQESEISPIEDLMREHGVLHRILLIYRNIICRISDNRLNNLSLICHSTLDAANIAKSFIEDYHQVLEEQYIFPRFEQSQKYQPLVQTLLRQHDSARSLSDRILQLLSTGQFSNTAGYCQLENLLSQYVRMYEPHSAREDTTVFPEFHYLVSKETFDQLGEVFEEIEEQKFGENGFQTIVQHVARIEQTLGIYDLNQYTPDWND